MANTPKPLRRLEKKFFFSRKVGRRFYDLQKKHESFLRYYILVHRKPYPVSFFYWSVWFENPLRRIIKRTSLPGGVGVSTVFLGLDHGFDPNGPPILFETMIFGGDWNQWQECYTTYEDAVKGHEMAIKLSFEVKTQADETF